MGITHDDDRELETEVEDQESGSSPDHEEGSQASEQRPEDSSSEQVSEGDDAGDDSKSRREALIAELTGNAPKQQEESDEEEEEDGPDGSGASDDSESEEADDSEDENLEEISDEEKSKLKRRTRKRIEHFQAKLREAKEREPLAAYGEEIISFARENQINPDDLSRWVGLGAVVNRGGEEAVEAVLKVAEQLGWQRPDAAPQQREREEAPADGKLPGWLQAKVDSYDIDLETAQDIARRLPKPQPPQQQAPNPPAAPAPRAPQQDMAQREIEEGTHQIETLIAEASAKYPADWEKRLFPQVKAKMAEFRGAPASQWPKLFKLALDNAVASTQKPPKRERRAIAPSSGKSTSGGTKAKTPRERMLAKLTGG